MTLILPAVETPVTVPYIVTWSEEQELPTRIIESPRGGIGFADEVIADRDRNGVLWTRMSSCAGRGRPKFAAMHPLRQRRAMRRLFCQICGRPADQDERGVLWVLPDRPDGRADWPNGKWVVEPPICRPCAPIAVRLCPALRRGYIVVRVGNAPICGVKGLTYRSTGSAPAIVEDEMVAIGTAKIRWTLGEFLMRRLSDCTLVEIDRGSLMRRTAL
jgi:hypothetical protein